MFEIGTSLREARLRRRIDLMQAEHDTKVRSKYLSALEQEDFSVLPGPVYAKGFLRSYADYLGLDGQLYVDEYNSRFATIDEFEQASQPLSLATKPRRIPSLRFFAVVSLMTLGVLAWLGFSSNSELRDNSPTVVRDSPTAAPERPAAQAQRVGATKLVGEKSTRAAPSTRLTVRARSGSSWVEVRDGGVRGSVKWSGTITDGASKSFRGRRLYVTLGYPAAIVLRSGGKKRSPASSQTEHYLVAGSTIRRA